MCPGLGWGMALGQPDWVFHLSTYRFWGENYPFGLSNSNLILLYDMPNAHTNTCVHARKHTHIQYVYKSSIIRLQVTFANILSVSYSAPVPTHSLPYPPISLP